MKYRQITNRDKEFAEKVAKQINKDYPGVAIVVNDACMIVGDYYKSCEEYVSLHCRIKPTHE